MPGMALALGRRRTRPAQCIYVANRRCCAPATFFLHPMPRAGCWLELLPTPGAAGSAPCESLPAHVIRAQTATATSSVYGSLCHFGKTKPVAMRGLARIADNRARRPKSLRLTHPRGPRTRYGRSIKGKPMARPFCRRSFSSIAFSTRIIPPPVRCSATLPSAWRQRADGSRSSQVGSSTKGR